MFRLRSSCCSSGETTLCLRSRYLLEWIMVLSLLPHFQFCSSAFQVMDGADATLQLRTVWDEESGGRRKSPETKKDQETKTKEKFLFLLLVFISFSGRLNVCVGISSVARQRSESGRDEHAETERKWKNDVNQTTRHPSTSKPRKKKLKGSNRSLWLIEETRFEHQALGGKHHLQFLLSREGCWYRHSQWMEVDVRLG